MMEKVWEVVAVDTTANTRMRGLKQWIFLEEYARF
jgi:hypothetical protein